MKVKLDVIPQAEQDLITACGGRTNKRVAGRNFPQARRNWPWHGSSASFSTASVCSRTWLAWRTFMAGRLTSR